MRSLYVACDWLYFYVFWEMQAKTGLTSMADASYSVWLKSMILLYFKIIDSEII